MTPRPDLHSFRVVTEELARSGLAALVVILFGAVMLIALSRTQTWDQTREVLEIFVPPLIAFAGTALGYYLKSQD